MRLSNFLRRDRLSFPVRFLRPYSTEVSKLLPLERIVTQHDREEMATSAKNAKYWSIGAIFGFLPAIIGLSIYAIPIEIEEYEHLKKQGPPKYIPAPYLRRRKNPFPWGDNTWFENEHVNAKPPKEE